MRRLHAHRGENPEPGTYIDRQPQNAQLLAQLLLTGEARLENEARSNEDDHPTAGADSGTGRDHQAEVAHAIATPAERRRIIDQHLVSHAIKVAERALQALEPRRLPLVTEASYVEPPRIAERRHE
jgi:hypothetical protein